MFLEASFFKHIFTMTANIYMYFSFIVYVQDSFLIIFLMVFNHVFTNLIVSKIFVEEDDRRSYLDSYVEKIVTLFFGHVLNT